MRNGTKLALVSIIWAATAWQVSAQNPHMELQALDQLEPGLWQIEVPGKPVRTMCLTDPAVLLQLAHTALSCSRFVIANEARTSTVHYSCNAAGWGRTTVHVETARAAQIDTQGMAAKVPFQFSADAHKIGVCVSAAVAPK
jgi:hypothetical protein